MQNPDPLARKLEQLETRIAFQDQTIEDLNQTLTAQWAEISKLRLEISRLSVRVEDAEAHAGSDGEPPPPHY